MSRLVWYAILLCFDCEECTKQRQIRQNNFSIGCVIGCSIYLATKLRHTQNIGNPFENKKKPADCN